MEKDKRRVETSRLSVEVEISGPPGGPVVVLLHGWPDNLRTWDLVLPKLHAAGLRTVVPSLRGHGETRFKDPQTPRSAQTVAMARDCFELADALEVGRFALVGHDWGARIAFDASILASERLSCSVAISLGWKPGRAILPLSPQQSQSFWYQWYFATKHGEIAFREDAEGFCRHLWDTWSPPGWYSEADWGQVTAAWANPDWRDIVIHFYRSRWRPYRMDPEYDMDEKRSRSANSISVPTRVVFGSADACCLAELSEGCESYFSSNYSYDVLAGIGHFPQREAVDRTAGLIVDWIQQFSDIGTQNKNRNCDVR